MKKTGLLTALVLIAVKISLWAHGTAGMTSGSSSGQSSAPSASNDCLPYTLQAYGADPGGRAGTGAGARAGSGARGGGKAGAGAFIVPSPSARYINLKYMAKEKLLFCLIPKVASSSFIRLFSRIAGVPLKDKKAKKRLSPNSEIGGHTVESLRQGRYQTLSSFASLVTINSSLAAEALNSPSWTRVAVLRDPAERLLSAWLDKIHSPLDTVFSRHKLLAYAEVLNLTQAPDWPHRNSSGDPSSSLIPSAADIKQALRALSFPTFVQIVFRQGTERGVYNPHWRPQSDFCGLKQIAPKLDMVMVLNYNSYYNFSGSGSNNNSATNSISITSTTNFVRCMFRSLVEKRQQDPDFHELQYTSIHKYTRARGGGFKYTPKVSLLEYFEQIKEELKETASPISNPRPGQQQTNTGHVTAARQHMALMYDAELLQKVYHLYRKDYELLDNLHRPLPRPLSTS